MVRFFQWLDDLLSQIVPVAYLLGTLAATISYFSGVFPDATVATGICLGAAVEAHYWLQQRRTREAWGLLSRLGRDDLQRDIVLRQFRVQVSILALLGLFSAWNSNLFLAAYWHPAATAIPTWLMILVRGSVVPVLILLSGALVPLHEDPGADLSRASAKILRSTMRDTVQQMKQRIKEARERGSDLAPVTVALLLDASDVQGARRLRMIHEGLRDTEGEETPASTRERRAGPDEPRPIPLATRRRRARKGKRTTDPEGTVRRLLAATPDLPLSQLMAKGHLSMSMAHQLRKKILAEMNGQQEVAA